VHFGESPPSNEENLALLREGDIVSHCFHGKEKPLWNDQGTPIPALEAALSNGILLDVAHGAASLSMDIAQSVVKQGKYDFSINDSPQVKPTGRP
jgi:dihydroorotase